MSIRLYIPINRVQNNSRKELETKITWREDRMSSTWDLSPPSWPLWCWINISIKTKVRKILSTPQSQQCTQVVGYVTIGIRAKITTLGVVWAQGRWMKMILAFGIWKRIRKNMLKAFLPQTIISTRVYYNLMMSGPPNDPFNLGALQSHNL